MKDLLDNFIEATYEWRYTHFINYKGTRYYPFIKGDKKFFMVYEDNNIFLYKDYKDEDYFILFCNNPTITDIKEALSYV